MGFFGFNNDRRGSGFGKGMPGISKGKRGTISSGNWDLDRAPNRGDCDPFNWRKQDGGEPFGDMDITDKNITMSLGKTKTPKCDSCGKIIKKGHFCPECIRASAQGL